MQGFIHETAEIEPGARIGAGTKVWHHAHIREGSDIGPRCVLGRNVFIDAGVSVGADVKIQNNVSVYRGVTLDDQVFVGPSVVFTNDLRPRAFNVNWQITPTRVRTGASIGANATIVCGVEIGAFSMVAAGSVVTRDVPAHQLVIGNPARARGWVCRCGRVVSHSAQAPANLDCEICHDPAEKTQALQAR
jgi:acetyltransferase-like isoleucine patch superfamily enzyme